MCSESGPLSLDVDCFCSPTWRLITCLALLGTMLGLAQTMGTAPEGDHKLEDDGWLRRDADVLPAIPACWLIPETTFNFSSLCKTNTPPGHSFLQREKVCAAGWCL
uniref:Uncharacterized protein n=2 Tax=Nothobranchius TaxID=28779 RepID=A0A1A8BPZ2_NOTKA